jgi:hypothetical protein
MLDSYDMPAPEGNDSKWADAPHSENRAGPKFWGFDTADLQEAKTMPPAFTPLTLTRLRGRKKGVPKTSWPQGIDIPV